MLKLISSLVSALVLIAPSSAWATWSGTASVDRFEFELIDTNLLDGIDPGITFKNGFSVAEVCDTSGINCFPKNKTAGIFQPVSYTVTLYEDITHSASVTSNGLKATVSTPGEPFTGYAPYATVFADFELSANTDLRIRLVSSFSGFDETVPPLYEFGFYTEPIFACLYGVPRSAYQDCATGYALDHTFSWSQASLGSKGSFAVSASLNFFATPVPEPSIAWMLLAGLGMFVTVVRSKHKLVNAGSGKNY